MCASVFFFALYLLHNNLSLPGGRNPTRESKVRWGGGWQQPQIDMLRFSLVRVLVTLVAAVATFATGPKVLVTVSSPPTVEVDSASGFTVG